jgi:arylsulfatase A-like enzyme
MPASFVFILADDLGYADLGCYGGRAPVSPRIDALAAEGLRFTRGYSNSPVCSPTRFALMTGRYQYRLRGAAEEPLSGRTRGSSTLGLPPSHPTLASLLRAAGYRTALIGKWHLGFPPHFGPEKSGYDEHFGPYAGGVDYFTHTDPQGQHDLWENGEETTREGYLTDLLSRRAAEFVRARGKDGKPFLLSLHYTAPHWPWETREDAGVAPELVGRIYHLDGGSIRTYQRMIYHMDEGIGQVLDALAAAGLAEDTLVVFTSDNGGERFSDNWPLVGGKMDLTEGGIRVPCVARWPRVVPAGGVTDRLAITMDWTATMLDAAGVNPHPEYPLDGISLLPVLRDPRALSERPAGERGFGERALYWRMKYRSQRALREGRWKYLAVEENEYLFDVEADERERANLARRHPQRLAAMRARYADWEKQFGPVPEDARVSVVYSEKDMPRP